MGPCEGASVSPWAQARSSADACDLQFPGTGGSAALHLPALAAHLQQAHSIWFNDLFIVSHINEAHWQCLVCQESGQVEICQNELADVDNLQHLFVPGRGACCAFA